MKRRNLGSNPSRSTPEQWPNGKALTTIATAYSQTTYEPDDFDYL